jgi:hypothetical protein
VNWVLVKVGMASIGRHSRDTSAVNLDDLEIVRSGAPLRRAGVITATARRA